MSRDDSRDGDDGPDVLEAGGTGTGSRRRWLGWLVAIGDEVVGVQLASGRVTRTGVPELGTDMPVSFLVGPNRAVIRPLSLLPGYVVPDGRRARKLTGTLSRYGSLLEGPKPGLAWSRTVDDSRAHVEQVGLDGRRTGVTLTMPVSSGLVRSDGRGYPMVWGTGGVYAVRTDGLHRITTGDVVAAGPTGWLAIECDARYRCRRVVVDGADGDRHPLPGRVNAPAFARYPGTISPDGSTAALPHTRRGETDASLTLVDLDTGSDHRVPVGVPDVGVGEQTPMAWSPDSRLLFVVTSGGKLSIVDAATRATRPLEVELTDAEQVAVRGGPQQ